MAYLTPREAPITVLVSQKWSLSAYKMTYQGATFPVIDHVPAAPGVPAHGLLHGAEGDVVVNVGDIITVNPATGDVAASSWYALLGGYEEVVNAPS